MSDNTVPHSKLDRTTLYVPHFKLGRTKLKDVQWVARSDSHKPSIPIFKPPTHPHAATFFQRNTMQPSFRHFDLNVIANYSCFVFQHLNWCHSCLFDLFAREGLSDERSNECCPSCNQCQYIPSIATFVQFTWTNCNQCQYILTHSFTFVCFFVYMCVFKHLFCV